MTARRRLFFSTAVLLFAVFVWSYLARPALPVVAFKKYRRIGSFNLPVFSVTNPADSDFRGVSKYEVLVNGVWQQTGTESCVFEHTFPLFPSEQTVEVITAPHIPPNATAFRVGFAITIRDRNRVSVIDRISETLRIPIGYLESREIWSAPQSRPAPSPVLPD